MDLSKSAVERENWYLIASTLEIFRFLCTVDKFYFLYVKTHIRHVIQKNHPPMATLTHHVKGACHETTENRL